MISGPGLYVVSVHKSNNPTYLSDGLYQVYLEHPYAHFRSCARHSGTFEKLNMLRVFEEQRSVVCTPVPSNREELKLDSEVEIAPEPGDSVIVRLNDARLVEGTIPPYGVFDTVAGIRIRVRSGDAVYLVRDDQIVSKNKQVSR